MGGGFWRRRGHARQDCGVRVILQGCTVVEGATRIDTLRPTANRKPQTHCHPEPAEWAHCHPEPAEGANRKPFPAYTLIRNAPKCPDH